MKTLILARNPREAGTYAASMGIPRQHFRAVQKAAGIRNVRNAEVHMTPGFLERRDRHGMIQALRGSRHLELFYVDPADLLESSNADIDESRRTPTDRDLEVAYRYNALRELDTSNGDAMESEGAPAAPAPKPRKPRTPKPTPAPMPDPNSYFA